jgi:hypothetical protein
MVTVAVSLRNYSTTPRWRLRMWTVEVHTDVFSHARVCAGLWMYTNEHWTTMQNQTNVTTQEKQSIQILPKMFTGDLPYRRFQIRVAQNIVTGSGEKSCNIQKSWNSSAIYPKYLSKCFEFSLQTNFLGHNLAVTELHSQVSDFVLETSSPHGAP